MSRKPLNTGRPLLPATANSNGPVSWTPERIEGLGTFLAAGRWLVAPVHAAEAATERPTRPAQAYEPVEAGNEGGTDIDEGLSGLLAAIADEVHGRVAAVLAGLSVEFAARIAHARKTLPPHQVAGAVAVLKQMQKTAAKAVRENASSEVKGRQKTARVQRRRGKIRAILSSPQLN